MNKGDPLTQHAISDMMNDFRVIRNDELGYTKLRPSHVAERHRKTLGYIKQIIDANKDKKCVVVGHHAPSFQSIGEQYKHDTLMNGGYASDLSEFILDRPQIKLWTHGHMHQTFDYMIGETRVVCNPRGYESAGEVSGWDPSIMIEI
jgi:Icc-related predicted phosphoesterase